MMLRGEWAIISTNPNQTRVWKEIKSSFVISRLPEGTASDRMLPDVGLTRDVPYVPGGLFPFRGFF